MTNRRLGRYARGGSLGPGPDDGDQEETDDVQDDDQDVDKDPCEKCGAADAVQSPKSLVSDSLPDVPMCRLCIITHL